MLTKLYVLILLISLEDRNGELAQLGERMAGSHEVTGSNPVFSTIIFLPFLHNLPAEMQTFYYVKIHQLR